MFSSHLDVLDCPEFEAALYRLMSINAMKNSKEDVVIPALVGLCIHEPKLDLMVGVMEIL